MLAIRIAMCDFHCIPKGSAGNLGHPKNKNPAMMAAAGCFFLLVLGKLVFPGCPPTRQLRGCHTILALRHVLSGNG